MQEILSQLRVSIATDKTKFPAALNNRSEIAVEGVVKGGKDAFITKVGQFDVDLSVEGIVLLVRQSDRPGIVAGSYPLSSPSFALTFLIFVLLRGRSPPYPPGGAHTCIISLLLVSLCVIPRQAAVQSPLLVNISKHLISVSSTCCMSKEGMIARSRPSSPRTLATRKSQQPARIQTLAIKGIAGEVYESPRFLLSHVFLKFVPP